MQVSCQCLGRNGGFLLDTGYHARPFPFVSGALQWNQAEIYSILIQLSRARYFAPSGNPALEWHLNENWFNNIRFKHIQDWDTRGVKSHRISQGQIPSPAPGKNFVGNLCMNSNWFEFLRHVAGTEWCPRDMSFRVNSLCNNFQRQSHKAANLRASFHSQQNLDSLSLPPKDNHQLKPVNEVKQVPATSLSVPVKRNTSLWHVSATSRLVCPSFYGSVKLGVHRP